MLYHWHLGCLAGESEVLPYLFNNTLVGEETMGGYYGHTGHQSLDYTLPHTGIRVSFAWVDLKQDVPRQPGQPAGRGVMPDYVVQQSLADFLANQDAPLRAVFRLLAARHP